MSAQESLSSIVKRLGKDSLIFGLGAALPSAISFLLLPYLTRVLSPADYAMLNVLVTFNAFFGVVAMLGIDSGIVLAISGSEGERRRTVSSGLVFVICWSSVLAGLIAVNGDRIGQILFDNPLYGCLVVLAIVAVPLRAVINFAQGLLKWRREATYFSLLGISSAILVAGLTVICVGVLGLGLRGVLIASLSGYAGCAALAVYLLAKRTLSASFSGRAVRQCLVVGAPFAVAGIFEMLLPIINRFILVDVVGLEETGLYASGFMLCYAITVLNSSFSLAYQPFVVERGGNQDGQTIAQVAHGYLMLLTLAVGGMLLAARPMVHLVLGGGDYRDAFTVMPGLLLATWLVGLRGTFEMGLVLAKKTFHVIWIYGLTALLSVPVYYFLARSLGIVGVAWGTAFLELCVTGCTYFVCQRAHPMPYASNAMFKFGALCVALLLLVGYLPDLNFWGDLFLRGFILLVFAAAVVSCRQSLSKMGPPL